MIQEITEKDLNQVAEIHKKFLPSIIAYYSVDFIEKFYKNHLLSENETRIFLGEFNGENLWDLYSGHIN